MKLINQSYCVLGTPQSVEEAWEFIERATRCCYQSERTKDSTETSEQWCRRILIKHPEWVKNHGAMLEHGTIYLKIPNGLFSGIIHPNLCNKYIENKYSKVVKDIEYDPTLKYNTGVDDVIGVSYAYITTNLRVILENNWESDLKYACSPTEHHIKRYTVQLTTNRAMLAELTRHRTMSFAVESTRYCNYSKGKFGVELTFIEPCWDYKEDDIEKVSLVQSLRNIEHTYLSLIGKKLTPQQAATILPNALKVQMYITGFAGDWEHLFDLRVLEASGSVHPQMMELMKPVYQEFVTMEYL